MTTESRSHRDHVNVYSGKALGKSMHMSGNSVELRISHFEGWKKRNLSFCVAAIESLTELAWSLRWHKTAWRGRLTALHVCYRDLWVFSAHTLGLPVIRPRQPIRTLREKPEMWLLRLPHELKHTTGQRQVDFEQNIHPIFSPQTKTWHRKERLVRNKAKIRHGTRTLTTRVFSCSQIMQITFIRMLVPDSNHT